MPALTFKQYIVLIVRALCLFGYRVLSDEYKQLLHCYCTVNCGAH